MRSDQHGAGPVRWSVRVPECAGGELLALADGRCLLSARRVLAVLGPPGEVVWLVETEQLRVGSPVWLDSGAVCRIEGDDVVVRDPATGRVSDRWASHGASALMGVPDGDVVLVQRDGGGALLVKAALDGAVRWSRPLREPSPYPPVWQDGAIVVVEEAALHAVGLNGETVWSADPSGMRGAGASGPRDPDTGRIADAPLVLDDDLLLIRYDLPVGSAFHLFDSRSGTVDPWQPPIAVRRPLASVRPPGGLPAVVGVGPAVHPTATTTEWIVTSLGVDARVRWQHQVPAQPRALRAGRDGDVLVFASPSLDRWRQYHGWYDLSDECFVLCLDDTATVRWRWSASEPLVHSPAVGQDGTVFASGRDRLWALG